MSRHELAPVRASLLRRETAILLLAAVALGWGTAWPVTKPILQDVPPLWTTAFRCAIGTATLFAISIGRGGLTIPQRGDAAVVLNVALLHMVAFAALVSLGLQFVPAGRSVVLGYTTPLWVTLGARIFLGEVLTQARTIGIVVGIAGVLLLFNPSAFVWHDRNALLGNLLILAGALCWTASILHVRAHRWILPRIEWSARLLMLLIYGGAIGVALPYWAMQCVNRDLPATTTALGLLAVPLVGVACSSIALGESLDATLIVAALLIISGIAIGTSDTMVRIWPSWR
jgi:drug/metabolite transporter (DMT)-like permease